MKKNKLLRRISVGIAALALICTSAVATSFAKYQTTVTGTDTIQVAKWDVTIKDATQGEAEEFTLNLVSENKDHVAEDRLAPGQGGSFSIIINNAGDVDISYALSFTVDDNMPTNLNFYSDAACSVGIVADEEGKYSLAKQEISIGQQATAVVYWNWAYETTDGDETDTNEGIAAANMKVDVTVIATQVEPTAQA